MVVEHPVHAERVILDDVGDPGRRRVLDATLDHRSGSAGQRGGAHSGRTDAFLDRTRDDLIDRGCLVRLLRHRTDWTVAGLAAEVSASRRTVLRDLVRLRDRGYRIIASPGPGGGVHLDPTSVMVTSRLETDEVVALILSTALSRAATWVPFVAGAERALAKIETALPARRVDELQHVMSRIMIGDLATDVDDAADLDPGLVSMFEAAFTTGRLFAFDYTDARGRTTRRRVEPHGLLVRPPLWYVIAWDAGRDAARLFRADRIRRPTVEQVTFVPRPHDLVVGVCPDARPADGAAKRR